MKFAFHKTVNS